MNEKLNADKERLKADLSDTVQDVKEHVAAKAGQVKEQVVAKAGQVRSARQQAQQLKGQAKEQAGKVLDKGTMLSWPRNVELFGGHNTIMDNMINLEMLFWAAKNGNPYLADIAISHKALEAARAIQHIDEFAAGRGDSVCRTGWPRS